MTIRLGANTGIASRGQALADADFALAAEAVEVLVSGDADGETTIDDAIYSDYTPATIDNVWHLTATETTPGAFDDGVQYTSLDTGIATVDSSGQISRVADGTAAFVVRPPGKSGRKIRLTVSRTGGGATSQFDRYVSGSLGAYAANAVDSRLSGAQKAIYTTQNHSTATYVRNASCWAADIDLTCISPWNSTGANKRGGTLISPRHIIFAEHYQISTGATVRFVTAGNVVVERTMTAKQSLSGGSGYETDLTIGLLDSDVPGSIGFARVMPAGWADYLPSLSHTVKVPCLAIDQEEKALVNELYSLATLASFDDPDDATRLSFYENLISGDSGNPGFLIDGSGLVLLTTWTFGYAGGGPNISAWITELNAIMTTLGGGYQLTPAVWSGTYTNFGA